jgi:S-adenosylmethionine:tRNA ribosyltransferase-isomerase
VVTVVPTYDLPVEAIAQTPVEPRDSARLLVDRGPGRAAGHLQVRDLPSLVRAGDVVVLNETRVLHARLLLRKPTGGVVEVLLLEQEATPGEWSALVRPSKKVPPGSRFDAGAGLVVEVGEVLDGGRRRVRVDADDLPAALAAVGQVPLPPYITTPVADPARYQTVYARRASSVAAPTAGLHLTDAVLDGIRATGARIVTVDLTVGLGTFRPVTADRLEDHDMHEEAYSIPPETMAAVEAAERVVAVGTTSVRALETAAATGELAGRSRLLITPGFEWRVVDALLTNFHQPRSTLLAMVEAFVGPHWRDLYATALADGYRFLSFGDAMFLERRA